MPWRACHTFLQLKTLVPGNESIKILFKICRIYLLTMLYRFPKRERGVTYEKSKKIETKVGYKPIFAPFSLTTHVKFDNFFLEYLLYFFPDFELERKQDLK